MYLKTISEFDEIVEMSNGTRGRMPLRYVKRQRGSELLVNRHNARMKEKKNGCHVTVQQADRTTLLASRWVDLEKSVSKNLYCPVSRKVFFGKE